MNPTKARARTGVRSAPPLDPAQLARLRAALVEQREFRLDQLFELSAPEVPADELAEVTATLRDGARFALVEIDAALGRLRAGSYGRCTACGEGIPVERLEIIPMAALCVGCQRAREHGSSVP